MSTRPDLAGGDNLGFRRRCCWCGVELRGWQLNACRLCKRAIVYSPSPPVPSQSRWDAKPDRSRLAAALAALTNTQGGSR